MSFDAKIEAVGSVEAIDTDGRCAAARVNRVLSCLRSLPVAPSQQARLMLSDHQDRRHPCPSARVCVSLRPDQPCQHPGARLARCVRLKIPSLTGRFPVAAKIEVNRSALVHVRGASPPAQSCKLAIRILRLQTDEHVAGGSGTASCRICSINEAPAPAVGC